MSQTQLVANENVEGIESKLAVVALWKILSSSGIVNITEKDLEDFNEEFKGDAVLFFHAHKTSIEVGVMHRAEAEQLARERGVEGLDQNA